MPLPLSQLPEADDRALIYTTLKHIEDRFNAAGPSDPVTQDELLGLLEKINLVLLFGEQAPGIYTAMAAKLNALGVNPDA